MFELARCYSRREIHDRLGGSIQSYLPTVEVRGPAPKSSPSSSFSASPTA